MKRLVFVTLVITAFSISAQAKYSGGSGTAGDPYKIGSVADLLALAADTNDYDANFVLTADIDLTPYSFTTAVIARDTDNSDWNFQGVAFRGVFDGAGHKISNLTINTNGVGNDYLGLFGDVNGCEIKNLGLKDVNITGGNNSVYLGGLVGNSYNSIISNCYSAGAVGGVNSFNLGGLVGDTVGGSISDCYSIGTVTGGNNSQSLGGLIGYNYDGTINNCYSTDAVTGGSSSLHLGGLVGENDYGSISNCYSTGAVTGGDSSRYLGGLAGINDGSISNCYSTGTVTGGSGSSSIGGLVGYLFGTITHCYFLNTSGPSNGYGTPLTDTQMKQQNSFVGWDFNTPVWKICDSREWQFLKPRTRLFCDY